MAAGAAGGRYVPDAGMGRGRDAAADGDLFPAVHAARGRGVSAARGVQSRPPVSGMPRLRQAGTDDVHGARLQRGGCGRLPDHRLRARTAARRAHQQPHAVQRPLSGAHRAHDHVLFPQRQHAHRRTAAHGGAHAVRGADVRRNVAAERDRAARQTVGLRAGAAAVPRAAGRSGARALRFRPDAVRARARRRRGSAGRDDSLDAGKRAPRRCEPADALRGCARPARAHHGYGRRAAAGVRARLSGQRDCAADRRDGLSGTGQSE